MEEPFTEPDQLWSHMVASSRFGMTPRVCLVTMIVTRQVLTIIVEMWVGRVRIARALVWEGMSVSAVMSGCEVMEKQQRKLPLFGC